MTSDKLMERLMDGWTAFWIAFAIPVGFGCGLAFMAIFGIDLVAIVRAMRGCSKH